MPGFWFWHCWVSTSTISGHNAISCPSPTWNYPCAWLCNSARYFLCFDPHYANSVFPVVAGRLRQFVQIPCLLASRRLTVWSGFFWFAGLGLLCLRSAGLPWASMVLLVLISAASSPSLMPFSFRHASSCIPWRSGRLLGL